MRRIDLAGLCLAGLLLQACQTPKIEPSGPNVRPSPPVAEAPVASTAPRPVPTETALNVLGPAALPGWVDEDHLAALRAWQGGCGAAKAAAMQNACNQARRLNTPTDDEARRFFEETFKVQALSGTGVLTSYFAPEYQAREKPDAEFSMPVRPTPADLKPGATYPTRTSIEARPPNDALAWMRAEDLFFLQVQGSGTLTFSDGTRRKAMFAAHNSRTFAGIANPMRDRGLLAANNTSGDAIRQWLADNRGPRADEIMQLNPRYVFFRLTSDDGIDPVGAANIPLPGRHAIAIDPAHHAMGELIWIDAKAPILAGAFPTYQSLVVTLDTGGAIKGKIRADLYMGRGDAAGREAGRVRHDLKMYQLVPREAAP